MRTSVYDVLSCIKKQPSLKLKAQRHPILGCDMLRCKSKPSFKFKTELKQLLGICAVSFQAPRYLKWCLQYGKNRTKLEARAFLKQKIFFVLQNAAQSDSRCSVNQPLAIVFIAMLIPTYSSTLDYTKNKYLLSNNPGACIIKLITTVIYGVLYKRQCLSVANLSGLVQCLVFSVQGQTLQLIRETVNYGRNEFYDTGPRLFCPGF